jgi:hypothetical protein
MTTPPRWEEPLGPFFLPATILVKFGPGVQYVLHASLAMRLIDLLNSAHHRLTIIDDRTAELVIEPSMSPAEALAVIHLLTTGRPPSALVTQAGASPVIPKPRTGLPRVWGLFRFLLDRHTREGFFDPAFEDMLGMYFEASQYAGKLERLWLKFAFTVRTAYTFADCVLRMFYQFPLSLLTPLLPKGLARWWRT